MITLTLASGTGVKGGTVMLALAIASTGGDQCTGVQFSFGHTADISLTSAVLGTAAIAASKMLNRAGDLCSVWGLNIDAIADGELLVATFTIAANPSSGSITISIDDIVASDADANPLTSSGVSGIATVDTPVLLCPVGSTARINVPYSTTLVASGGLPPYTYSITG